MRTRIPINEKPNGNGTTTLSEEDELSASEDEEENERNGVRRQPGMKRRRNIMDYQNPEAAPEDEDIVSAAVSPARRNGTKNGAGARHSANGSVQEGSSSHDDLDELDDDQSNYDLGDQSDVDDEPGRRGGPDEDDGDVDMEDNFNNNNNNDHDHDDSNGGAALQQRIPTPQRQEATPPDSPPPAVAAQPTAPTQQAANDIGNGDMDEGDTIEDLEPALAKDHGREEREAEGCEGGEGGGGGGETAGGGGDYLVEAC